MTRNMKFLAALLLSTTAIPAAASADTARVTTDLTMRAGPGRDFPAVGAIGDGARVNVHGCVNGYRWCDASWHGLRGWLDADYLTYSYHDRYVPIIEYGPRIDLPIISFSVGSYWDDYYRSEPWFGRRDHWRSVWHDGRDRNNHKDRRSENRDQEHHSSVDRHPGQKDHRSADRGQDNGDRANRMRKDHADRGQDHGNKADHGRSDREARGDGGDSQWRRQ
jgi:uncharacterized protein YraI